MPQSGIRSKTEPLTTREGKPRAGKRLACPQGVIPLVAVSGAECVEALTMAGFTLTMRTDAGATLTKDLHVVVVPDVPLLAPDELTAILRSAGLPYTEFLELLSEAPTDPAISRTRLAPSVVHR